MGLIQNRSPFSELCLSAAVCIREFIASRTKPGMKADVRSA